MEAMAPPRIGLLAASWTAEENDMRPLKRSSRTRLLRIARMLDGWSAAIKHYCEKRTPKRPRAPKVPA